MADMAPATPANEARRAQMLQSAAELISERGFAETRIADVAKRAEVSSALVIYYFGTRDRLLVDALRYSELNFYDTAEKMLAEVTSARERLALLVARHESGGVELLVGLSTDPVLGPVVVVGSGGVTAEAIRDVQRSVLPLTRERAATMLSRLHIAPLLDGWRGAPAADKEDLIETILRVAALAESGAVLEMDINPLLARPDGVIGLDALVRLAATAPGDRVDKTRPHI